MAQPDSTLVNNYGAQMAKALWSSKTGSSIKGNQGIGAVSDAMKTDLGNITKNFTFDNISKGLLGMAVNKQLKSWDSGFKLSPEGLSYEYDDDDDLYYLKYGPEHGGNIQLGANFKF